MDYSEKILVLKEYLELDGTVCNIEDIIDISDLEYSYDGTIYRILDDTDLNLEIQNCIESEISAVQYEIDQIDLNELHCDFGYYMKLEVDEDIIINTIQNNYKDFVGAGEVDVFDDYYIFKM